MIHCVAPGLCRWHPDKKDRTASRPRRQSNRAAVCLNRPFRNCQSKPCSASVSRTRFVDAKEPVEYAKRLIFGDSCPLILNSELHKARLVE